MTPLELVLAELHKYEHRIFDFSAEEKGNEVELVIHSKVPGLPEYRFTFTERELESPQFSWNFQRLLYDCLRDYVVELFTKCP